MSGDDNKTKITVALLGEKIDNLASSIREENKEQNKAIREIMHPQTGVYPIIERLNNRLENVENYQANQKRFNWILTVSGIGALMAYFKTLITKG
jgi:hypothetical protein